MTCSDKLERGHPSMTWPFDETSTVSTFQNPTISSQRAKKKLIATHPKLEIAATRSKHRTSPFLIATKNTILESPFFSFYGPCVTNRSRPRRFECDSNQSEQSLGDASNHHKMRGLHTRH